MTLDKIGVLKIDKDCFISRQWMREYVETICQICKSKHVTVTCIKMSASRKKGLHFYISITPEIEAALAVYLQFLLGDDSQRVDYCRARVDSQLNEWNKLFEVAGRRLKTIYTSRGA